jgi:hypothetical protein
MDSGLENHSTFRPNSELAMEKDAELFKLMDTATLE